MIDDQLQEDARALLAAGRDRMGPDAATVARLRARVQVAVVVGATATTAGVSAASASAAPAASATAASTTVASTTAASVVAKSIAVKLVLLATVGTGAYVAHDVVTRERATPPAAAPQIAPPSGGAKADVERVIAVAAPEPAPVESEVAPAEVESPEPVIDRPRRAPTTNVRSAPAIERAPEPKRATLSREIELVDRVTLTIRDGDLLAALATLGTYDAETGGHGQLAQDAAALHIEVLCRMHDPTATSELIAFDKRWPRSAQRSHLTGVCTELAK